MPRVSVIIPTYNRAEMLKQAIESVLAQTFRDFEIVVVDDGSTDNTHHMLATYPDCVHYIYQENQERSAARNRGVASSTGEYLVFLDSDDLLLPNMLELLVAALDCQLEVGLMAGGYQYINENGEVLRQVRPWLTSSTITLEILLFYGLVPINSVIVRRYWVEKVRGFNPTLRAAEDMDFWYRLSLAGCCMAWERSIVCQYRIHESNSINNIKRHYAAYFAVLDDLFARSDIPIDILKRKQEIYTQVRLRETGQLFAGGELEDARALLKNALMLDPMLSEDHECLTNAIVDWQKSVWVRDPSQFLETVFEYFPPEIASAKFRKHILSSCRKSNFNDAYNYHDDDVVREFWIEIAKREPAWLLNRGGWSILLQSLGIKSRRNARFN